MTDDSANIFAFPSPLFRAPEIADDVEPSDEEMWDIVLVECLSPCDTELLAEHLHKAPNPMSSNAIKLRAYIKMRIDAGMMGHTE